MAKPTSENQSAFPIPKLYETAGLTKREFAAIFLRVPASGNVWLDDMIRRSHYIVASDPEPDTNADKRSDGSSRR